ncbi:restriction endonuclease [Enterococcus lactis]|uniref:restriction endonuclease n=1 Tax=Enterococcus TaxID=1350 RepID=UPI00398F5088
MLKSFLQKVTHKTEEINSKEVLSKKYREVKGLSFVQNDDETIVIDFLNNMDKEFPVDKAGWRQQGDYFEQFLAAVFRLANYEVEVTKKEYQKDRYVYTGDNNIDLIIKKDDECIAVQAKHYRLNTKAPKIITVDYIKHYSGISDKGWTNKLFITTSLFNPYVYMEIEKNEKAQNIEWYDRYGLLQLLNHLIPKTMEKYIFLKSLPEKVVKCPKCESGFIVDKWSESNHSYFRACTMYPECKNTEKSFS